MAQSLSITYTIVAHQLVYDSIYCEAIKYIHVINTMFPSAVDYYLDLL